MWASGSYPRTLRDAWHFTYCTKATLQLISHKNVQNILSATLCVCRCASYDARLSPTVSHWRCQELSRLSHLSHTCVNIYWFLRSTWLLHLSLRSTWLAQHFFFPLLLKRFLLLLHLLFIILIGSFSLCAVDYNTIVDASKLDFLYYTLRILKM